MFFYFEFQALNLTDEKKNEYLKFTQIRGVTTLESLIDDGPYCVGDSMTLADLCFVPQINNVVNRFKVRLKNKIL